MQEDNFFLMQMGKPTIIWQNGTDKHGNQLVII